MNFIGSKIAHYLENVLKIYTKAPNLGEVEIKVRYNLEGCIVKMLKNTKEWVGVSTAVLSVAVYEMTSFASLAFVTTILLTPLLWLFVVKVVYPKSVTALNFGPRFKEAMEGKFVSSVKSVDEKLIVHSGAEGWGGFW
jgi:hypothetical protein